MLLQSDDLLIEEAALFTAVLLWADAELDRMTVKPSGDDIIEQRRTLLIDIIPLIRFGLLDIMEVATIVAPRYCCSAVCHCCYYHIANHTLLLT